MSTFNKEYVHCVEDKDLYGNYGYFSDSIDTLERYVTNNNLKFWGRLSYMDSPCSSFPFVNEKDKYNYRFFYHDPSWKRGAAPYSRRATNRELAHWLNKGNGECIRVDASGCKSQCHTEWPYTELNENMLVGDVYIRKWCDDEWHDPDASYMELD